MADLAFFLEWYGPFSTRVKAAQFAKHMKGGLYSVFGYSDRARRGRPSFEYVGISQNLARRITYHSTLDNIDVGAIWLSEFDAPLNTRDNMKMAEWLLIHALGPNSNDRKHTAPPASSTLINRFWNPLPDDNGYWTTPQSKPGYLPDIIYFEWYKGLLHYIHLDQKSVVTGRQ